MNEPSKILVTPQGAGTFRVEVRGRLVTTHTVTVPGGLTEQLGWGEVGEVELVRESFAFLLEREPATSILPTFDLDIIGRYFPEFPTEIRRRSGS